MRHLVEFNSNNIQLQTQEQEKQNNKESKVLQMAKSTRHLEARQLKADRKCTVTVRFKSKTTMNQNKALGAKQLGV